MTKGFIGIVLEQIPGMIAKDSLNSIFEVWAQYKQCIWPAVDKWNNHFKRGHEVMRWSQDSSGDLWNTVTCFDCYKISVAWKISRIPMFSSCLCCYMNKNSFCLFHYIHSCDFKSCKSRDLFNNHVFTFLGVNFTAPKSVHHREISLF